MIFFNKLQDYNDSVAVEFAQQLKGNVVIIKGANTSITKDLVSKVIGIHF